MIGTKCSSCSKIGCCEWKKWQQIVIHRRQLMLDLFTGPCMAWTTCMCLSRRPDVLLQSDSFGLRAPLVDDSAASARKVMSYHSSKKMEKVCFQKVEPTWSGLIQFTRKNKGVGYAAQDFTGANLSEAHHPGHKKRLNDSLTSVGMRAMVISLQALEN